MNVLENYIFILLFLFIVEKVVLMGYILGKVIDLHVFKSADHTLLSFLKRGDFHEETS